MNVFKTEIINCPYCESNKFEKVRISADIVQCIDCGIVYLRTRLTENEMYKLYQFYADGDSHMKLPENMDGVKKSDLRREKFVKHVIEYSQVNSGRWLDVGCGWGALLDNARENGYSPYGIEMTRKCCDFAAMQLSIPVSNLLLEESLLSQDSFKIVTMVHVLEHLPYPKKAIQKVNNILEKNGLFCGIVPNFDSLCSNVQTEKWEWLDPFHHYVHYTPGTLKFYLNQLGFEVLNVHTISGDYDRKIIFNILEQLLPMKTNSDELSAIIKQIEIEDKGEEIWFFSRKR